MGTPNREPQEYSRNLIEYKDPGRYIPIIFLLYSWGSLFGVPIRVPLSFMYSPTLQAADRLSVALPKARQLKEALSEDVLRAFYKLPTRRGPLVT